MLRTSSEPVLRTVEPVLRTVERPVLRTSSEPLLLRTSSSDAEAFESSSTETEASCTGIPTEAKVAKPSLTSCGLTVGEPSAV